MFFKIGVLKNFVNFARKYLCWSSFLIKACNFIKKRLQHRYFPVKFVKFSKMSFWYKARRWLLLLTHLFPMHPFSTPWTQTSKWVHVCLYCSYLLTHLFPMLTHLIPENIRKPYGLALGTNGLIDSNNTDKHVPGFLMFSGIKWVSIGNKWVNG